MYANIFWTKHLLAYCGLLNQHQRQFSTGLQAQLQLLLRFRKNNTRSQTFISKDADLGALNDVPDIKKLVSDVVEFQSKMVRDTALYETSEGNSPL